VSAGRLLLLQICDSLFPVGSFAHSDGLEAAVDDRRVSDAAGVRLWLQALLHAGLSGCDGPALRIAMTAWLANDTGRIAEVDDEVYALRPSWAAREATRRQGARLLRTWLHVYPSALLEQARAARPVHTFPVAFGMVCGASGLPMDEALEAFFYTRLAASVSAAMRLMPLGQHEAQKILGELLRDVPACAARVAADSEPPRCFAPHQDIASMAHQYVHSRLFRS
jgi:urease accessory protein